jgi:hypothetical protein
MLMPPPEEETLDPSAKPEGEEAATIGSKPEETDLENLIRAKGTWSTVETYIGNRLDALMMSGSQWRRDLERFQRQAENNFDDRLSGDERRNLDPDTAWKRIFSESNSTMDIVGGFADFIYAQAANDIFGARPWLSCKPVGKADSQLAADVSRYTHHKFDLSNVESAYLSSIKRAVDLGTAFPKWIYTKTPDVHERRATVLADAKGKPVLDEAGGYIEDPGDGTGEQMLAQFPGSQWAEQLITETTFLDNNVEVVDVSFRDVVFDLTARDFDLRFTDVFTRVKISALDAVRIYGLDIAEVDKIQPMTGGLQSGSDESSEYAEHNRAEQSPDEGHRADQMLRNHAIELWEGFVYMDPVGDMRKRRMFVVYDRTGQRLLKADYLWNVTPKGTLPIHPLRIYKLPGRAYGVGIYQRYEHLTNDVDGFYNSLAMRAQFTKPITGMDRSVIENDDEAPVEELDIRRPVELKTGRKLSEYLQFLQMPESGGDIGSLLQQLVQIGQMRTGLSAASQGELSSVPDNSTATGIKQLQSRAAVLLKWPINDLKRDCLPGVSYGVRLLLSNMDIGEVFAWGEGDTVELVELTPKRIRGLEMDVKLSMSQTQNMETLENTAQAIQTAMQYMQIPEPEKTALRPLFVQSVKSLGFDHADQFIREPIFSPEQILPMLPPDVAAAFQAFLMQMQGQQPQAAPVAAGAAPAQEQPTATEQPPSTTEPL